MSIRSELIDAARAAKSGSFKTREARSLAAGQLADFLKAENIQIREVSKLKPAHVVAWIQKQKAAGISLRTMQNRVSSVRQILTAAGFDRRAQSEALTCRALGINGASRDGTRKAISCQEYQERRALVKDAGVGCVLDLQKDLGLRQQEGIMARIDVLTRWERELRQGGKITVVDGTKGGRVRSTLVLDREQALQTVRNAIKQAESTRGMLIACPGLKEAKNRFNNHARAAGFKGMCSPHAIRYAFAQESIRRYEAVGVTHREAVLLTSRDLGHGDGRGRWIEKVYCRDGGSAAE